MRSLNRNLKGKFKFSNIFKVSKVSLCKKLLYTFAYPDFYLSNFVMTSFSIKRYHIYLEN